MRSQYVYLGYNFKFYITYETHESVHLSTSSFAISIDFFRLICYLNWSLPKILYDFFYVYMDEMGRLVVVFVIRKRKRKQSLRQKIILY